MMRKRQIRVTFSMPLQHHRAITKASKREDVTMAQWFRRAIRNEINRRKRNVGN